ncbi:MAG: hypothetical protein LBV38_03985 [Alistipes sp.]|jgi:hypothetical protein|nr:hypothetical protein [Alistipes sp.]
MELIISPAKVAESAFRAPDLVPSDAVSEAVILAAQQKFVRPVLGAALYEAVCRGQYPTLTEEYLAPPLALYVKLLMLPALAVQSGVAGVVEATSRNFARAGDSKIYEARRRLRGDARALMMRAVEHIESLAGAYPEYSPRENVMRRVSTEGGVILPKISKIPKIQRILRATSTPLPRRGRQGS